MAIKLLSNPGAGPGTIGKLLAKHMGPHLKPAVLIKLTNTTRTAGAVSGGLNPTSVEYKARGFVGALDVKYIDGTTVIATDVKISLLAATIGGGQIPTDADKVRIEGTTYRVIRILGRDPDAAMYTMAARK